MPLKEKSFFPYVLSTVSESQQYLSCPRLHVSFDGQNLTATGSKYGFGIINGALDPQEVPIKALSGKICYK